MKGATSGPKSFHSARDVPNLEGGNVRLSRAHGDPIRGNVKVRIVAKHGKILTTSEEIRKASADARRRERTATKIRSVRYDRASDTVVANLSTGCSVVVPRRKIPA